MPLVTGDVRRYANLDHAASAPCLVPVKEAVDALLPWYPSVHRGAGFPSQVATAAYEGAREAVLDFVGARPDDAVVFTKQTTEAINVLATALPDGVGALVFAGEHHANLLAVAPRSGDRPPGAGEPGGGRRPAPTRRWRRSAGRSAWSR